MGVHFQRVEIVSVVKIALHKVRVRCRPIRFHQIAVLTGCIARVVAHQRELTARIAPAVMEVQPRGVLVRALGGIFRQAEGGLLRAVLRHVARGNRVAVGVSVISVHIGVQLVFVVEIIVCGERIAHGTARLSGRIVHERAVFVSRLLVMVERFVRGSLPPDVSVRAGIDAELPAVKCQLGHKLRVASFALRVLEGQCAVQALAQAFPCDDVDHGMSFGFVLGRRIFDDLHLSNARGVEQL